MKKKNVGDIMRFLARQTVSKMLIKVLCPSFPIYNMDIYHLSPKILLYVRLCVCVVGLLLLLLFLNQDSPGGSSISASMEPQGATPSWVTSYVGVKGANC